MRDRGHYVISINKFVKWMAEKVEAAGITIFTGFAASEVLFDGDKVIGVQTDDKGVDKNGQPKANFEPGYDLRSKVTIFCEGSRGSCTKQIIERFHLEDPNHAQVYGVGIKELWEVSGRPRRQGRSHLHAGLSAHHKRIRRCMDLRNHRHAAFHRLRDRSRLRRPAHRSASCLPVVQGASPVARHSGRWKDGSLWRQDHAVRRMELPCRDCSAMAGC